MATDTAKRMIRVGIDTLIFGQRCLVMHNGEYVEMAYQGRYIKGGKFRFVAAKKHTNGSGIYFCLHCASTVELDTLENVMIEQHDRTN